LGICIIWRQLTRFNGAGGTPLNPKFGWTMSMDRELIVLSKTKTLDAIAAHFERGPVRVLKRAMRLGY
jgi:hypothetical protein